MILHLHRGPRHSTQIDVPGGAYPPVVQVDAPDGPLVTYERTDWFFDGLRIYRFKENNA